jgi:2-deoxy-D-gluconate 3-dehydrogenase
MMSNGYSRTGPFGLEGRATIVTGASSGIGRAIAIAFAEAGADVAILGRRMSALAPVSGEIESAGRRCVPLVADLRDVSQIRAGVARAIEELGTVHTLVNCAGTVGDHRECSMLDVEEEAWDAEMDVLLKGVFFASQAVARHLIGHGGGSIIHVSSNFGLVGYRNYPIYCTAKGGLTQMAQSMADDLASRGVNVNVLAPGAVTTESNAIYLDDDTMRSALLEQIPARRIATPEDIAHAAVFLASPASQLLHGACLVVDGGFTAV